MAKTVHLIGKAICEALGIDANQTVRLRMILDAHSLEATVEQIVIIKQGVDEDQAQKIGSILKAYKLVPLKEEAEKPLAEWDGYYPPFVNPDDPPPQPARFVVYARHEEGAEDGDTRPQR